MRIVLHSMFALLLAAMPAVADETAYPLEDQDVMTEVNGNPARLLACFEQVMMPATVLVEPILIAPERRAYVKRRDGTIDLVEYPARYREKRTVLEPSYVELRQIPCKKKKPFFGLF
jgi:hypothetical protein